MAAAPGRLPAARRSHFAQISQAQPLAWLQELTIDAYVMAYRRESRGGAARVTLLRTKNTPARVREVLSQHAEMQLAWSGVRERCTPDRCRATARFVDPRTLRIDSGTRPRDLERGDVDDRCRGHFPPGDERFKDADSAQLAVEVRRLIQEAGFEPVNLDLTFLGQRPRIGPRADAMRARIAEAFGLSIDRVGLKATTLEGLGALGRDEGLACQAVAMVRRRDG